MSETFTKNKIKIMVICAVIVGLLGNIFSVENVLAQDPSPPEDFTATPVDRFSVKLSWTPGANADFTYIERNSISLWVQGEGDWVCNVTTGSYVDPGLSENTLYYYQAWSWNRTNNTFSPPAHASATTLADQAPILSNTTPADNLGNVSIFYPSVSVAINDPEGDPITWTIHGNHLINATQTTNGTVTATLIIPLPYNTNIVWYVNASDGILWSNATYNFTTSGNQPPVFSQVAPADNLGNVPTDISSVSVFISDPEGSTFNWSIEGHFLNKTNGTHDNNGIKTAPLITPLPRGTNIIWYVNASDGISSSKAVYNFTTRETFIPEPPTAFTATPMNRTIIYLTWNEGIKADRTYIERNTSASWPKGNGVLVYFGTGTSAQDVGLTPNTLYYYQGWSWNETDNVSSTDSIVIHVNLPPVFSHAAPANNSNNVDILIGSLSLLINDSEDDSFSWHITTSPDVGHASGMNAHNGTITCPLSQLAYSTTYVWYVKVNDGHQWANTTYRFTTVSNGGGGGGSPGGGGGGGTPPPPVPNVNPIADLSFGKPYQGSVNEEILFDGSKSHDPDGVITRWFWSFGDGTNATGESVVHTYQKAGYYQVYLRVADDDNATDMDATTCLIIPLNIPPSAPIITGTTNGPKNTFYTYTAYAVDKDNDSLQYMFSWGDSATSTSNFMPSGQVYKVSHSWTAPGRYKVTVRVTDNRTISISTIMVYIDAQQMDDIGYLLDTDSDGVYDAFYSDAVNRTLAVQMKEGCYNIDSDGDGHWDYTFDATRGLMKPYQAPLHTPGFDVILCIMGLGLALVVHRKRQQRRS